MRARVYCAHPSIRDHWALRYMSRCPDQVISLKRDPMFKSPSKLGTHLSTHCIPTSPEDDRLGVIGKSSRIRSERKVLDESRSFIRVHTGYFSNIPKCIKAEFIASWACSQSSVVSSSKR
ncbi:hypothetical protein TNCV_549011 [Trichonephila clavipes]|nr:hypothetical protein TNCV_549011 [Trichonephila clavipes]